MTELSLIQRVKDPTEKDLTYKNIRVVDVFLSQNDISLTQQLPDYRHSHNVERGLDNIMDLYVEAFTR